MNERLSITAWPWHPFLFGVYFVLFIYEANVAHQLLSVIWIPIMVAVVVIAMAVGLAALLARSLRSGALVCTIVLTSLLLFLNCPAAAVIGKRTVVFALILAVHVLVIWAIGKDRRNARSVTRALNLMALCCVASVSLLITMKLSRSAGITADMCFDQPLSVELKSVSAESPDIVYIVLDGYTRNDVLEDLYGFDNAPFTDALKEMGFYVADQARANYCQTGLSMACALNLDYLSPPKVLEPSRDRQVLHRLIHGSRFPAWLSEVGYKLRIYESGYYLTSGFEGAQEVRTCDTYWNEFQIELVHLLSVWMPAAIRDPLLLAVSERSLYPQHRQRVEQAFALLAEEPLAGEAPTFTFLHVMTPHPPFIFADDGLRATPKAPYSLRDGAHLVGNLIDGEDEYQRLYVSQLQRVNELVLAALAPLTAQSTRPRIIVLQADHGAGSQLDWEQVLQSNATERLGILNAIYLSDGETAGLYPSISTVNTARTMLNRSVLKEPLPLLEDRSYLSAWPRPYRFFEIP